MRGVRLGTVLAATLCLTMMASWCSASTAGEVPAVTEGMAATVAVCFTPGERCEDKIAAAIDRATDQVQLQAYYLTSTIILRALRNAASRNVRVEAVLDRVNAAKVNGSAHYLQLAGAKVWIDRSVTIAHSKIIIIDLHEVIGGSFNYTKAAQDRNAENVTFTVSDEIAAAFYKNWEERRAQSKPYLP